MRRDLIVTSRDDGETIAVKDPLALQYFEFSVPDWEIIRLLRKSDNLREWQSRVAAHFPDEFVSLLELKTFLQRAIQDRLVTVDQSDYGQYLFRTQQTKIKFGKVQSIFQVLAFRFRGIDPDAFLDAISIVGKIVFHPVAVCLTFLLSILLLFGILLNFDSFYASLPELNVLLQGRNLIWMMVALSLVKVLHELGHGLCCKRFGSDCNEIGVMLLAFTPCLYCNVTDSWMMKNRWHRLFVAAAGIYVELMLAVAAFLIWYFSVPGVVHSLAFNVMAICSINTLLLNGNPLLRYDGYYVLSDLLKVPNLSHRAKDTMKSWMRWAFVPFARAGESETLEPEMPSVWLALFGVASWLYRWFVLLMIFWFVLTVTRLNQIAFLGQAVVAIVLVGMSLGLLSRVWRWFRIHLIAPKQKAGLEA